MFTTILLFITAITALLISFIKSKNKTVSSLKSAFKAGKGMISDLLGVLLILGLILNLIPPDIISGFLGNANYFISSISGALIGTITIIPGVVAFPLAKELLDMGALPIALAAFITTLTMVGFVTLPVEIRHFGVKYTLYRNSISFVFAIIIALFMGAML